MSNLHTLVRSSAAVLLDWVLPPACLACRRHLRAGTDSPLCSSCRPLVVPLPPEERELAGVHALYAYEGPLRSALTRFKFGADLSKVGGLAQLLARAPTFDRDFDVLTWIPTPPLRRLRRGIDHARELARATARRRGLPSRRVRGLLQRTRHAPPQSTLAAAERELNVHHAFAPADGATIAQRRIVVLDDVTTTGATMRAAMAALRGAGALEVRGACLLRALHLD